MRPAWWAQTRLEEESADGRSQRVCNQNGRSAFSSHDLAPAVVVEAAQLRRRMRCEHPSACKAGQSLSLSLRVVPVCCTPVPRSAQVSPQPMDSSVGRPDCKETKGCSRQAGQPKVALPYLRRLKGRLPQVCSRIPRTPVSLSASACLQDVSKCPACHNGTPLVAVGCRGRRCEEGPNAPWPTGRRLRNGIRRWMTRVQACLG